MRSAEGVVAGVPCLLLRIGFVGESGWELHFPADYGDSLEPAEFERLVYHLREAYLGGEDDGPRSFAGVSFAVKGTVPAD